MIDKIIDIANKVFKTNVSENTNQSNCSAWDSLHHLNFVVELEIEFDISFEPEEIAEMKSISAIHEIIKSKL